METAGDLGPGVRRLRPDDHFMVLMDVPTNPLHIGALQYFEVPPGEAGGVADRFRRQIAERLPQSPLLVELRQSPDGYDSDVWVDVAEPDLDYHLQTIPAPIDEAGLRRFIAGRIIDRLDLSRPPFRIFLFPNVEGGRAALYVTVHHALTDGIAFQAALSKLRDETGPAVGVRRAGALPSPEAWRAAAEARFAAEAPLREQKKAQVEAALAMLKSGELPRRAKTPSLKLSGPSSLERSYDAVSLPFERVRALAKAFGGTINDIFLAMAASAVRRRLIELDDLPEDPIVVNSARSYRRPEHGDYGNRIVALHPHLATHIEDPVARLRAIQASMAVERARTQYDEALLDGPERPYGARQRRERFASPGSAQLPGNVTLSNVPGPAEARFMAGFRLLANYPTPIVGLGRFLNITSRRYAGALDLGIAADSAKFPQIQRIGAYLKDALAEYEALAG